MARIHQNATEKQLRISTKNPVFLILPINIIQKYLKFFIYVFQPFQRSLLRRAESYLSEKNDKENDRHQKSVRRHITTQESQEVILQQIRGMKSMDLNFKIPKKSSIEVI
jgi:hypothetical protein